MRDWRRFMMTCMLSMPVPAVAAADATEPPGAVTAPAAVALDALGIAVSREQNRAVSFTNKRSAYFYTQTHVNDHVEHAGFSGFNIAQRRVFAGYEVRVDGRRLDPAAAEATVFPDRLQRRWADGAETALRLFDHRDLVEVEVSGAPGAVQVTPAGEGVALLSSEEDLRFYSTMASPGQVIAAGRHGERYYLVVADSPGEAAATFAEAATAAPAWRAQRERRLAGLLEGYTAVQADDAELARALRWLYFYSGTCCYTVVILYFA